MKKYNYATLAQNVQVKHQIVIHVNKHEVKTKIKE